MTRPSGRGAAAPPSVPRGPPGCNNSAPVCYQASMTLPHVLSASAASTSPDLVLAGAGPSALVEELGLCLLSAGFLSALFERLRVPTIAALLCAGVALGPNGFGLIQSGKDIEVIANLGLTL